MKKNIIKVNPVGLKGNEVNERIKELMGISPINENKSTSVVELTKKGPDGKIYAVVRENHEYYLKSTTKSENLVAGDFEYIGGLQNKKREVYPSYAKAIKHLNLKFNSLKEAYNVTDEINVFEDDNLLTEVGNGAVAAGFANLKSGFSGEGNLENNTKMEIEGEVTENEEKKEDETTEEDELTEIEKDVDDIGRKGLNINENPKKEISEVKKLSIIRAMEEMDAIIDGLAEGEVKKKVYKIK